MSAEKDMWQALLELAPDDVCARAPAVFDASSGAYSLAVFGEPVRVVPSEELIAAEGGEAATVLERLAYFSRLAILHYLVQAENTPPSGRLIKPSELRVGQVYYEGSHVLPLDKIADKYSSDAQGFMERGRQIGAVPLRFGDASLRFVPLPRLPVTMILWVEDDEFPARAELLFDSTCERHLPPDVLWAVAMVSVLVLA